MSKITESTIKEIAEAIHRVVGDYRLDDEEWGAVIESVKSMQRKRMRLISAEWDKVYFVGAVGYKNAITYLVNEGLPFTVQEVDE